MAQYTLELENAIVSDDFVLAGQILDRIHAEGVDEFYINQVVELLHVVPVASYGMAGPVLDFIKKQNYATYLDTLLREASEHPSEHSIWCLRNIISQADDDTQRKCLTILREVAGRTDVSPAVRDRAGEIVARCERN